MQIVRILLVISGITVKLIILYGFFFIIFLFTFFITVKANINNIIWFFFLDSNNIIWFN